VICFQKQLSEKETASIVQAGGYADAPAFYDYLNNRVTVKFMPKTSQNRDEETFELALSKKMFYEQFSAKVGEQLKAKPTHIRFWTINASTGNAKTPVKPSPNTTLQQVLTPHYTYGSTNQLPGALFFEVLDLSLSELETKKSLKITWLSEGITKEVSHLALIRLDDHANDDVGYSCGARAQERRHLRYHPRTPEQSIDTRGGGRAHPLLRSPLAQSVQRAQVELQRRWHQ
jgi:ubiquitin carboxyl-terminal hydrolase 7